jgi:hypothetical protein
VAISITPSAALQAGKLRPWSRGAGERPIAGSPRRWRSTATISTPAWTSNSATRKIGGGKATYVYYSAYNGSSWSAPTVLSGPWGQAATATDAAPALAGHAANLFAAWREPSGAIAYSVYTGSAWLAAALVPGATSAYARP